jgi:hypothetical protein
LALAIKPLSQELLDAFVPVDNQAESFDSFKKLMTDLTDAGNPWPPHIGIFGGHYIVGLLPYGRGWQSFSFFGKGIKAAHLPEIIKTVNNYVGLRKWGKIMHCVENCDQRMCRFIELMGFKKLKPHKGHFLYYREC